jgi:hypothetical protein
MERAIKWEAWLALALGGFGLLGCESADHRRYPDDPLFLSKKPVEGKWTQSGPQLVASNEPVAPIMPTEALATTPFSKDRSTAFASPSPSVMDENKALSPPKDAAKRPVLATPVSRTIPSDRALAGAPGLRKVPGIYGHATDYSWLQGVLERHYRGPLELRYCDLAIDDPHGGKVSLEADPRLDSFKEGDIVVIEGEMRSSPQPREPSGWRPYPPYRVRQIWGIPPEP